MLLWINPKIKINEVKNIKPILNVLLDNSSSINYFNEANTVNEILKKINTNNDLQNKFDVKQFQFSRDLNNLDSLSFKDTNTNIYQALKNVSKLNPNKIAPTILVSDGNQTLGSDYTFFKGKQAIYPLLIGDTTKYVDVKITQLNVNRYSFVGNKFPIEVLLNYDGDAPVTTQFIIQKKGKTIFRKNISFSADKNSQIIQTNLTSSLEGLQFYKAYIRPINNEKNTANNEKSFSVEVINEQTKVLILTSIIHPDLGALKKAITANKQNSVDVISITEFKGNIKDYQLVILNQPNNLFKPIVDKIKEESINYLLISGTATEWEFLNAARLGFSKNAINQFEDYLPSYNQNYLTFFQEDIGFNDFPPLKDKFGKVSITEDHQTLFYQNINGFTTQDPILATFSKNNQKVGLLFGEGIWKWRAASFLNSNSFSDFDKFVGNLIQYLASNKRRNRLEVNAESLYNANSVINVTAFYTDKNYKFDSRANLELTIKNAESKKELKLPFSLKNSSYQVVVENLSSGNYDYKVNVLGQNISKNGKFRITNYNIEEQFTNANRIKMNQLATNNKGKLFYKSELNNLIDELMINDAYVTIQKQITKEKELINWKWILVLIIILLTIEWYIRKYLGKI